MKNNESRKKIFSGNQEFVKKSLNFFSIVAKVRHHLHIYGKVVEKELFP